MLLKPMTTTSISINLLFLGSSLVLLGLKFSLSQLQFLSVFACLLPVFFLMVGIKLRALLLFLHHRSKQNQLDLAVLDDSLTTAVLYIPFSFALIFLASSDSAYDTYHFKLGITSLFVFCIFSFLHSAVKILFYSSIAPLSLNLAIISFQSPYITCLFLFLFFFV
ncbi:hypothetical protein GEMRC1_001194 [Eukaryota sp. GEM-RC1]